MPKFIFTGIACPFCGGLDTLGRGTGYLCTGCGQEWGIMASLDFRAKRSEQNRAEVRDDRAEQQRRAA